MASVRLTYLDTKGVGEAIRLALHVGGVEFEDRRVDYDGVRELRNNGELPWSGGGASLTLA